MTNPCNNDLFTLDFDVVPLTARETDDFTLDVQMVTVANFDMEPIVVSAILDNKVEDQGTEAFLLSIPDNPGIYIVGQPSVANVYIKGINAKAIMWFSCIYNVIKKKGE